MYELELITLSMAPVFLIVGWLHGSDHVTTRMVQFFMLLGIAILFLMPAISVAMSVGIGLSQYSGAQETTRIHIPKAEVRTTITTRAGALMEPVEVAQSVEAGGADVTIRRYEKPPLEGVGVPFVLPNVVSFVVVEALIWAYVLGYYMAVWFHPMPVIKLPEELNVSGVVEIDDGIVTPLQGLKPIADREKPPVVVEKEKAVKPQPIKVYASVPRKLRHAKKPRSVTEILYPELRGDGRA